MSDYPADPCPTYEEGQPEVDYSGGSAVNRARKRSGKPSKEAKAAQMRRYRARHRSQIRAYMRRYMAARRARAGRGADPAAGDL